MVTRAMEVRYSDTYKKGTCGLTDGEHYSSCISQLCLYELVLMRIWYSIPYLLFLFDIILLYEIRCK